jgi:hypothetical protein
MAMPTASRTERNKSLLLWQRLVCYARHPDSMSGLTANSGATACLKC